MNTSLENYFDKIFSTKSQKKDKSWMQDEAEREKEKGTTGALRNYFKLKDDEHLTIEMIDKELERLKKKYIKKEGDKYPPEILKLVRRLNLAKTFLMKNKNIKKK